MTLKDTVPFIFLDLQNIRLFLEKKPEDSSSHKDHLTLALRSLHNHTVMKPVTGANACACSKRALSIAHAFVHVVLHNNSLRRDLSPTHLEVSEPGHREAGTLAGGGPAVRETCIQLYPQRPPGNRQEASGRERLGEEIRGVRGTKAQTGSAPRELPAGSEQGAVTC